MGLQRPELLLLLLPTAWLWWWARDRQRGTQALRAAALFLLVLALASPYLSRTSPGRDLVVVIDRSRSMTADSSAAATELLALAEEQRGSGDRVALVTFGARSAIELIPSEAGQFDGFERIVDPDGSNLGAALDAALELIPEGRDGSILLLSDGELRGRDPLPAARRAFGRGIRIDVRPFTRPGRSDLAVERLELPESVSSGDPFQGSAWIRSDSRRSASYRLARDGRVISSGERIFEPGLSRIVFRDVVPTVGLAVYELEVGGAEDRVPENNRALGALNIEGPRVVLLVNHDGQEDSLARALRRSGQSVQVASPEAAPLDRIGLEAFRAVILENVAADRIGRRMEDLASFVRERGGGLLVTGGQASFGIGGYYLSPLDPVLPVSMELRKEQRKQGMALAIAMDRSGSMGMSAGAGTKMDLANLGAVAAIDLLSDLDSVAVLAVDTEAEVVQEMAAVEDPKPLQARVRRISPGGGGIYVFEALQAAVVQLERAPQLSKHITLFSDASDSEQPEGCRELVARITQAGVSLSVIALGSPTDADADFLRDLANIGGGEIYFTTSADELPRLFAQDTLTASRSAFVDQPTGAVPLAELYGLGELVIEDFPTLGGYNLTYLREGAVAGVVTTDEYQAPVLAFGYEGLGRSAAFTGQVGGSYGQELVAWKDFTPFFLTTARWLLGQDPPEDLFPTVFREGREAVIQVELDPNSSTLPDASGLEAHLALEDGTTQRRSFERLSERLFEARFPLENEGIALPAISLDPTRSLRLPPVALPYSPEFEPTVDPEAGERLLRQLARESGGEVAPAANTLFRGERSGRDWRSISTELLIAALLLILLEVLFRRLALWGSLREAVPSRRLSREERAQQAAAAAAHASSGRAEGRGRDQAAADQKSAPGTPQASLADALTSARARARRELDR